MKLFCKTQDDNGVVCNRSMSKHENEQDGMCSRCAELIWANFAQPLITNKPTSPIIFEDSNETQPTHCQSTQ